MQQFRGCLVTLVVWCALVVSVSAQPVGQPQTITVIDSGTACVTAPTACAIYSLDNQTASVTLSISGTWTGTLTFEGTNNGGTWTSLSATNTATAAASSTTTANGLFSYTNTGIIKIRLRATAAITGGAVVTAAKGAGGSSFTGSVTASSASDGPTASAVPVQASYSGLNDSGILVGAPGDATNGQWVNCKSGCSGGTTDTDDGTIAGGQSTGITLGLNQVWDGANWKRWTIGTAGSAAAQVVTVQGISSGTPMAVTCSSGCAGGTTDTDDGTVAGGQTTGIQIGLGQVWDGTNWKRMTVGTAGTASAQVITVQGVASMTALTMAGAKTNNNAAPGATNIGVLPCQANASVQSWTEGNLVLGSCDLSGRMRVTAVIESPSSTSADNGTNGTSKAQTIPGRANAADPTWTEGNAAPLSTDLSGNLRVKLNLALPAGAAIIGKVGIDQTSPGTTNAVAVTNLPTTVDTNSGNKSASTIRVVLATDQPQLTNKLLVTPDANSAVNVSQINGVTPLMGNGVTGTGSQRVTLASDNSANTTPFLFAPATEATTTNSAATCYITSGASTNSTNCKASAGNVYTIRVINTTSTLYYLRMYNSASAPTCSSATGFVETIPVPNGTGAGGGVSTTNGVAQGYATGIGFCLTGGGSSTDNTNAATGVYVTILYK